MKVVSFSIWGNDWAFLKGALENIFLAQLYYPDWKVRIYCGEDVKSESRHRMVEAGADVRVVAPVHGAWEGLFWRFYPIWDPEVSHTISRDCDSRLNPREAAAVKAWLTSGKRFHTMRDHYQHIVPILGGMFGSCFWPELQTELMSWKKFTDKGDDQLWLTQNVWPLVKSNMLAHDRYPTATVLDVEGVRFVYDSVKFHGEHPVTAFPDHEPLDPRLHGEFVGSRVGIA